MRAWWGLAALLVLVIAGASALLRLSVPPCAPQPACVAQGQDTPRAVPGWHDDVRLAHRVAASAAGLVLLMGVLFGWARWRPADRAAGAALLAVTAGLAVLGRYTPSPQPGVALANLLGGHALLALVAWLLAAAGVAARGSPRDRGGPSIGLPVGLLVAAELSGAVLGTHGASLRGWWVPAHALLSAAALAGLAWCIWQQPRRRGGLLALSLVCGVLAGVGAWGLLAPGAWTWAVAHSLLGALSLAGGAALWRARI